MAKDYDITRVVFNDKNIQKLLKSTPVKQVLMKVGREIQKDVKAASGKRKYKYFTKARENSTRAVVYVGTNSEHAKYSEAKHGWLQAAAMKHRGVITLPAKKPRAPRKKFIDTSPKYDEDGFLTNS